MENSVALIVLKLEELIKAVGGKVEAFYPYVIKQQIIEGIMPVIALIIGIVMLIFGLKVLEKGRWDDKSCPTTPYTIVYLILGILSFPVLIGSLINLEPGRLLNADYYAVIKIIDIGKSLIAK